uniref:Uncharacterized protein n=1 Tax=Photinus pyralis TaxID=7054 RepID=A0A1Y1MFY4_PHOPY
MPSPVGNFQRPDEDFQYNAPPWEGSPLFSLEVAAWLPSPTPDIMEACGEVAMTHGIEALPTASAVMEFIKENLTGMEYASEYADNTFHQPEIPLQEQQRKQQGLTRRQRRNRRRVSIAVGPGKFIKMSRKEAEIMGLVQPQRPRPSEEGMMCKKTSN